jgi:co-chaperonin GroES (HSP10)
MELDCTIYNGKVCFEGFDHNNSAYPIKISINLVNIEHLDIYGQYNTRDYAKCVIYPKGKTTWEGFVPPCKFKEGDIIADEHGNITIYKGEMRHNKKLADYYCGYRNADDKFLVKKDIEGHFGHIEEKHLATEEEKAELFDAIKANGYKWNEETKTLEKLVEPKFKVGDRVYNKNYKDYIYDIHDITDKGYRAKEINADCPIIILFGSQEDNYELVPNKFDIATLKPFESRVLVREDKNFYWKYAIFRCYIKNMTLPYYVLGGTCWEYCIPYEGNEHLLGTTDDCDEFYKNW